MKEKITAIVPAAGFGKRFGEHTNKQFEILNDKPLIIWPLETMEAMPEIYEIIPVLKEEDMEYGVEIFEKYRISKVKRIAPGGRERQDSVFNGLNLIDDKKSIVLVHDGVRPLIESYVIREAIKQLKDCDGVVVGVPLKDTIKEAENGIVRKTLKRDMLWSVQTPQLFSYKTIYNAYENAMKDSSYSTDDSALVERYGGRIRVVMGSYANIKITTPEDIMIARLFLQLKTGET
ncbi:MAG: 2-C-methyl-D-erythritol 4-phosphate cytidylyltransferase [Nitrospirota bacterium]